jgi:hypothetical protein
MGSAAGLAARAVERPADAGWTVIGALDTRQPSRVDRAGLVTPGAGRWSLDWWIGADDRWHLPAREPTVRQRRRGPGPVVETLIRIPSGDARHLAYGAMAAGREVTVVEISNDSPSPVAVALALRPYPVGGAGPGRAIPPGAAGIRVDDRAIRVGGRPVVFLPRTPNRLVVAADDPVGEVTGGGELIDLTRAGGAVEGTGAAHAVVVYPVPHRTSLRVVLPAGAGTDGETWIDPGRAPGADGVVRGWRSMLDAGARFRFGDPGITELVEAARARCLLAAPSLGPDLEALLPGAGVVLSALAVGGHRSEIRNLVARLVDSFPTGIDGDASGPAEVVAALAHAHQALAEVPAPHALELAVQITRLVDRAGDPVARSVARRGLAWLAGAAGEREAAVRLDPEPARTAGASARSDAGRVEELVASARSTEDDAGVAARLVLSARSLLIGDDGGDLVLAPVFPPSWLGGEVEVHRAPTSHGSLSYAIRWHGHRPALLWQADDLSARLRCPRLDPDWATSQERGEALLAGTPERPPTPPSPGEGFH